MKKLLIHKIREGQFDPSPQIQSSIDDLNRSYKRAKRTIKKMHKEDEITLQESLDREFKYYGTQMNHLMEKLYIDEQKKMNDLRKEFFNIFRIDVWDEVILNHQFDTIEEFFNCVKTHIRLNYA